MQDLENAIQAVELIIGPQNTPIDLRKYDERFNAVIHSPDFQKTVYSHIANGGTLITLADMWAVRHSDLAYELNRDVLGRQLLRDAQSAREEWEVERLLQELRAIATADIRDAYRADGTLKPMSEMPANLAAAISSVESEELFEGVGKERSYIGELKKVKFWDKAKAIETFLKKHGLLNDRKRTEDRPRLEDLVHAANVVDAEVVDAQPLPTQKDETRVPEAPPTPGNET